jgi:hypothetical protein
MIQSVSATDTAAILDFLHGIRSTSHLTLKWEHFRMSL